MKGLSKLRNALRMLIPKPHDRFASVFSFDQLKNFLQDQIYSLVSRTAVDDLRKRLDKVEGLTDQDEKLIRYLLALSLMIRYEPKDLDPEDEE